jgi:cell division protein FtsB
LRRGKALFPKAGKWCKIFINDEGMKRVFIALAVVVFVGLIGVGLFGKSGLLSLQKLRTERERLEGQSNQLQTENQGLMKKIELLSSDLKYLEKLARQKLGMVKPDEVIIKVPQSGSTVDRRDRGHPPTPDAPKASNN